MVVADFHEWRVYCLVIGFLLLLIAPIISDWVPFYYSSSMVVGILLVVLVLLFQVLFEFGIYDIYECVGVNSNFLSVVILYVKSIIRMERNAY